jgi:hypothetical protein
MLRRVRLRRTGWSSNPSSPSCICAESGANGQGKCRAFSADRRLPEHVAASILRLNCDVLVLRLRAINVARAQKISRGRSFYVAQVFRPEAFNFSNAPVRFLRQGTASAVPKRAVNRRGFSR